MVTVTNDTDAQPTPHIY